MHQHNVLSVVKWVGMRSCKWVVAVAILAILLLLARHTISLGLSVPVHVK